MTGRELLAENIKYYRLALGLSQEQLAERCGLTRTYVGNLEQTKKNITLDNLDKVAAGLGVALPVLFLQGTPRTPIKNVRAARKNPPKIEPVTALCEWGPGTPTVTVLTHESIHHLETVSYHVIQTPPQLEDAEEDEPGA